MTGTWKPFVFPGTLLGNILETEFQLRADNQERIKRMLSQKDSRRIANRLQKHSGRTNLMIYPFDTRLLSFATMDGKILQRIISTKYLSIYLI